MVEFEYERTFSSFIEDCTLLNSSEAIQELLDGKSTPIVLNWVFLWRNTPEGAEYWESVSKSKELSEEAREKLNTMLVEYNAYMKCLEEPRTPRLCEYTGYACTSDCAEGDPCIKGATRGV